MTADPRGRWFRVYARQVRDHAKFRDLTGLELGAWLALRAEAELRDGAIFGDRAEALLILRRRSIPRAAVVLERLVTLGLFDDVEGQVAVHDRSDHDRPRYPSDDPEAVAERQRMSRAAKEGHESVTTRDGDSHDTLARGESQQAEPAYSTQPAAPARPDGELPGESDSATLACRYLQSPGKWLGDREYVAFWDELDRGFSAEWVQAELLPAYQLHLRSGKIKPWDFAHEVERRCAERARSETLAKDTAKKEAVAKQAAEHQERILRATPEQKEQAAYQREAIRIALSKRTVVPTDPTEIRQFVEKHSPQFRPTVAA